MLVKKILGGFTEEDMKKDLFYFYKRETKLCQGGIQELRKYDFLNKGFSDV